MDPMADTTPPADAKEPRGTPEQIGGYRVKRRLGGGGMGSVFEAEHANSGQLVAVKLIKPEHLSSQAVDRFRMEGRLASTLVSR